MRYPIDTGRGERKKRGFALLSKRALEAISSYAGKRCHELGVGHEFTSEEARAAGRKGGLAKAARRALAVTSGITAGGIDVSGGRNHNARLLAVRS